MLLKCVYHVAKILILKVSATKVHLLPKRKTGTQIQTQSNSNISL